MISFKINSKWSYRRYEKVNYGLSKVEVHLLIIDRITYIIRLIPQGTVNNNLGPDSLAGPKALDPNRCRQPILLLDDHYLEVLTVHDTELRLFWAKAFPIIMSRI